MNKSRKQREGQAVGSPRVHAYTLEKKTNTEVSNGAGKEQKMNLHSLQGDKAIRCHLSVITGAERTQRALESGPPSYHDQTTPRLPTPPGIHDL